MILNKLREAGANFRGVLIVLRWMWIISFLLGSLYHRGGILVSLLNRRLGNAQKVDEEKVPLPAGNRTQVVQSLLMELMRTCVRCSVY
jgi:hypothetical protein